ncbi:twin-arginine translocase TatA/TatE family subunit [Priestia megaterium]|uniref:twin-arginine translocase TatA/TatE family subunit n=1 Tax=Priestia megaterium TaxID=1404 RepID=UPI00070EE742|nr:twin-arginine translocase TatA/TatE family subunit [Priestia megaterium]KRD82505.1 preprotein translocase subunit TatA [Bacillus sp. Root147]MBE2978055.1 twin-arginine translocase TatA/TatE family subunit [Priestia megaterium]MBT2253868.1 twin-arginine translocase TatA/TatE family subunit [Priestia megaterium]MDH3144494.1 twin-arginine translocase TatA/TatE family subunit [Priestia megaterium]MED4240875.1 twin-arginine translocase TatA/TatE family subunit [Priestia megaterium]
MIGAGSAVLIGVTALIIFGPKRLPELGRSAGKTLREFKNATQGIMEDHDKEDKKPLKNEMKDDKTSL